jgi:hypothetical protein
VRLVDRQRPAHAYRQAVTWEHPRQVRIALRQQDQPLPLDTDRIAEIVITELIGLEDPPL